MLIAYFSQGIKRTFLAIILAFFIAVGVYGLWFWIGIKLPYLVIPIFMIIATIIELYRENSLLTKKGTYEKQQPAA